MKCQSLTASLPLHWIAIVCLVGGMGLLHSTESWGQNSLDEQLFQELDEELFSDLDPIQEQLDEVQAGTRDEIQRDESDLDRQLRRELGGDPSEGKRAKANPLGEIADSMKQVRRRIQSQDLATETQQIQGRIVSDLERLIAMLQKQKQPPNQSQQQKKKNQRQQNQKRQQTPKPNSPQPKPNQPGKEPGKKPGKEPAKESTTQRAETEAAEVGSETTDQMMQDAWGNLPAAQQQEMQSSRPEKFLPKYSKLIEEYFKRLAEDRNR